MIFNVSTYIPSQMYLRISFQKINTRLFLFSYLAAVNQITILAIMSLFLFSIETTGFVNLPS